MPKIKARLSDVALKAAKPKEKPYTAPATNSLSRPPLSAVLFYQESLVFTVCTRWITFAIMCPMQKKSDMDGYVDGD